MASFESPRNSPNGPVSPQFPPDDFASWRYDPRLDQITHPRGSGYYISLNTCRTQEELKDWADHLKGKSKWVDQEMIESFRALVEAVWRWKRGDPGAVS